MSSLEEVLDAEPREMVSISPELWQSLRDQHAGGRFRVEFEAAWSNGRAFLHAMDALRGRRPARIEWKGAVRAAGDEVVPADLRIDHVYLVSCKYLSKIVLNTSPAHLFDRLLLGGHGRRSSDWYATVAGRELEAFYARALAECGLGELGDGRTLSADDRKVVATALRGRWRPSLRTEASGFAEIVAERSADRWRDALRTESDRERQLLRLLRIGSAPYFLLGVDRERTLRLRIQTPWDWRQDHRVTGFDVSAVASDQPTVGWVATVEERRTRRAREVRGHVEVRWSHGKFNGPPEAKVYLDTEHHDVPGYLPLR